MNFPPSIITTLVGGPCDGQKVSERLFDGRSGINAFKQTPAHVAPYDEKVPCQRGDICHFYSLRQVRYQNGRGFVVFAHPDLSDAEVFHACERLPQLPPTGAL